MLKTSEVKRQETAEAGRPVSFFSVLWLVMAAATVIYAAATVVPFLTDLLGIGTEAGLAAAVAGLGLLELVGWAGWEGWRIGRRRAKFDLEWGGVLIVGLAFLTTFAYGLNQSAPFDNLPVGITADSTHHYALSDYIKTHQTLPIRAEPTDRARLVEMVTYPPAFHLGAALVSQLTGLNLAYTLFPLAAFLMALTSAATAALAYTLFKPSFLRPALALLSAYLSYLAYGFFFNSYMYWDFYGQVAGQAALGLGLYFALHFYKTGYGPSLALGSLAGAILVLAYTHWLPIVGLALVAAIVARPGLGWVWRVGLVAGVGVWLLLMAGLFLKDRLSGGVVWSGGAGADVPIREDGLGWLTFGGMGVSGLLWLGGWWVGRRRSLPSLGRWSGLLAGGLGLAVGGYVLWKVGNDLATVSPTRLYPFDNPTLWLSLAAGAGAILALFGSPLSRFYLGLTGGLVLEIAGYVLFKPGGTANAYHLSKLYTIGFVILWPVLAGFVVESVLVVGPRLLVGRLKPGAAPAPWWVCGLVGAVGLLVAGGLGLVVYNQLLVRSPDRPRITVARSVVDITDKIRHDALDRQGVELSVRAGIPAYFTYVGLLGQPRNDTALDYYRGNRRSFETWLYNPQSPTYLLTDEYDAILRDHPGEDRFQAVYTEGDRVALLTRRPDYQANLTDRRVLFLKFEGLLEIGVLTVNLEIGGVPPALANLTPVLAVGPYQPADAPLLTKPLARRPLPLTPLTGGYGFQTGYLKWRFADGYSRGEIGGQGLAAEPFKLADGQYSLWVQWWKDGQPVVQRKVQDFELAADRQTPLPPSPTEAARPDRTGQLLLEAPAPANPPALTEANTFFQQGDHKLLQITGWGVSGAAQPGQTLQIWQRYLPVADLTTGYVVFAHLLDAKGAVVAQSDFEPGQGVYPTWLWPTNQPVTFQQAVRLPPSLPPGIYSLEIGVYSEPGQKRLETWFYEPYLNRIWENHFYVKDVVTIKAAN